MTLRKVIRTPGSFPNEESALKLLYLALRNVAKKWHTTRAGRKLLIASRFSGKTASLSTPGNDNPRIPFTQSC